jgi:response regulator NasT
VRDNNSNPAPLRIVVADDDPESRDGLATVLSNLGYQVLAAANGAQLVELVRVGKPDLIITDIVMPGMDGIEAAIAVNRESPVPVILLSGHHDDTLVTRAAAANVMSYLVKPINEADLKTAIPLAMARFRQMQTLADDAERGRQALEERKLIEKAKGILMKRLRLEEQDAFRRVRVVSSSQNHKLVETCRQVVAADSVFALLEGVEPPHA